MDSLYRSILAAVRGFNALAPARRIALCFFVILTMGCMAFFVYLMNQTEYSVLFSDLVGDDASKIVLRLQEKKIPYKVSSSGTTIMVPTEKAPELRIEMAASGLTQGGGVGFEIFDKKSFGATEFVQKLNYQRALQGELSRTISSLEEITASRVHIAIPERSLFAEEKNEPTVSVVVKLKPGRTLQPAQVEGIVNLVAASVENLSSGNVMVVDGSGKILSQPQEESAVARMSNSQIEYQRNIEKGLAGRVQSMLERVVGRGKVVATVAARLDFRETEKTEELFGADEPALRSVHRKTERAGIGPAEGESSVTRTEQRQGERGRTNREKSDEILNYELNRVVSKTIKPVGALEKLSVAVLVDGLYKKNDKGIEEYQPRTKKEIELLDDLVKKAVGFDAKRGDQVVITNVAFRRADMEETLADNGSLLDKVAPLMSLVKAPLLFLSMALVLFFVLRPVLKLLLSRGHEVDNRREQIMAAAGAELDAPLPTLKLDAATSEEMPEITVVRSMASQDARTFSELLKNWLN